MDRILCRLRLLLSPERLSYGDGKDRYLHLETKTHETALLLPSTILAAGRPDAGACHHQPGVLAARSLCLPSNHRPLCHAPEGVHARRVCPRRRFFAPASNGNRICLACSEEFSGLLHQSLYSPNWGEDVRRRSP